MATDTGTTTNKNSKGVVDVLGAPFTLFTKKGTKNKSTYNRGDRDSRYQYALDHGLSEEYANRYADDTGSVSHWTAPWYDIFGTKNNEYQKGLAEYDSSLLSSLRAEMEADPIRTRQKQEQAGYNPAVSAMMGDASAMNAGTDALGSGQAEAMPEGGIAPSVMGMSFADSDLGHTAKAIGDVIGVAIGAYGGLASANLANANAGKVDTEIQSILAGIDTELAEQGLIREQTYSEIWKRGLEDRRFELDKNKYTNERQQFFKASLEDLLHMSKDAGVTPEQYKASVNAYSRLFGDGSLESEIFNSIGSQFGAGNGLEANYTHNDANIEEDLNRAGTAVYQRPFIAPLVRMAYENSALALQQLKAETKFKTEYFTARSGAKEGEYETLQKQYESNIAASRAKYEEASVGLYANGLERLQRLAEGCPKKSDFSSASDYEKYTKNARYREKCQSDAMGQYLMLSNNQIGLYGAESNKNKIKYDAQANSRAWIDSVTGGLSNVMSAASSGMSMINPFINALLKGQVPGMYDGYNPSVSF